jgi:hypothetical protein
MCQSPGTSYRVPGRRTFGRDLEKFEYAGLIVHRQLRLKYHIEPAVIGLSAVRHAVGVHIRRTDSEESARRGRDHPSE